MRFRNVVRLLLLGGGAWVIFVRPDGSSSFPLATTTTKTTTTTTTTASVSVSVSASASATPSVSMNTKDVYLAVTSAEDAIRRQQQKQKQKQKQQQQKQQEELRIRLEEERQRNEARLRRPRLGEGEIMERSAVDFADAEEEEEKMKKKKGADACTAAISAATSSRSSARIRPSPPPRPPPPSCRGRDLSYESALEALRSYHAIHDDLVIPRRFIVPPDDPRYPAEWHGLDLSSTVYTMTWWKQHIRHNPDRVAELNRLGFLWQRLQPEFNLILEALITYSALHQNLLVPTAFVVPTGDDQWPKATWGMNLGRHVYRMRTRNDFLRGSRGASRRSQLDGLGFVWDTSEHAFQILCRALEHFSRRESSSCRVHGTSGRRRALMVPSRFVVPSGARRGWPEDLWGYPLGAKCDAVRHKGLYIKNDPSRQRQLEDLGFQWKTGNAAFGWLEVVHAAAIYSQMNQRNLHVPFRFRVPSPPRATRGGTNGKSIAVGTAPVHEAWPWPEYLWGLPLGQRLKDVRVKGAYLKGKSGPARRAQLDALGFIWEPKLGRPKSSKTKACRSHQEQ